jgi:uncharacterized protein (TIGR02301 family)
MRSAPRSFASGGGRLAGAAMPPRMRAMHSAMAIWRKLSSALLISICAASSAVGQGAIFGPDTRPYDERLMRLSEILGAIHYLRELCGSNDGQAWRDRMKELMDAEGSTALRRAKLTRSFNNGYRSYSRTYNNCTPSAQTAITRFLAEGAEIAEALIKSVP